MANRRFALHYSCSIATHKNSSKNFNKIFPNFSTSYAINLHINFQKKRAPVKKIILFALAISAASVMKTSAQSVSSSAPCPCPCPQAFQGFYIGGNIGYGFGGAKVTEEARFPGINSPTASTSNNIRVKGADGGLNSGYNHRFCNFGLGLEGVFNWTGSKGHNTVRQVFPNGTRNVATARIKLENSIQLRANFSYIFDLIAPKIIIGWDNSKWTRSFFAQNVLNDSFKATQKNRYNGLLSGAGVDFLLTKYLIAGVEYTCIVTKKKSFNASFVGIQEKHTFRPQYNKFALVLKFIY